MMDESLCLSRFQSLVLSFLAFTLFSISLSALFLFSVDCFRPPNWLSCHFFLQMPITQALWCGSQTSTRKRKSSMWPSTRATTMAWVMHFMRTSGEVGARGSKDGMGMVDEGRGERKEEGARGQEKGKKRVETPRKGCRDTKKEQEGKAFSFSSSLPLGLCIFRLKERLHQHMGWRVYLAPLSTPLTPPMEDKLIEEIWEHHRCDMTLTLCLCVCLSLCVCLCVSVSVCVCVCVVKRKKGFV